MAVLPKTSKNKAASRTMFLESLDEGFSNRGTERSLACRRCLCRSDGFRFDAPKRTQHSPTLNNSRAVSLVISSRNHDLNRRQAHGFLPGKFLVLARRSSICNRMAPRYSLPLPRAFTLTITTLQCRAGSINPRHPAR